MATDRASSPITTYHADRTLNLLRMAIIGLVMGIMWGMTTGITSGIETVIVIGPTFGVMLGSRHAWQGYLVAMFWLATHKRLPCRLMAFLDDALRLGLLRAVGPVYQFRHAELQDHLADTYQAYGGTASSHGQA